VNENIKAFVKHNYITDSEGRIKWQLYGATVFFIILAWSFSFFFKRGNMIVDMCMLVFSITVLPIIAILRCQANMSNDNTRFIKLQIIYNYMSCIIMDVVFTYIVYKAHGGKSTLIVVLYQTTVIIFTFIKAFRKHETWIRMGAYKDYSEEISKWDRWHTKIWHKDSYISGVVFGGMLILGDLAKRGIFLIYIAAFSIQIPIIIDIVKYSLQLKYAKKYGLQDLLPSAPNEELKPW